jgi:hypothetical protein
MAIQFSLERTAALAPESFGRFSSLINPDWVRTGVRE